MYDHHEVGSPGQPGGFAHTEQYIRVHAAAKGQVAADSHREVGDQDDHVGQVDAAHHGGFDTRGWVQGRLRKRGAEQGCEHDQGGG